MGPKDKGYVDMFLDAVESKNKLDMEKNTTFQRTPIRPSGAGDCARAIYFKLLQYSGKAKFKLENMSGEQTLLFDLGHAIESHLIRNIRQYFKAAEVRFTQQVLDFGTIEAVNDSRLSQHFEGSIDLCLYSEEHKCVIDVKSKGDHYDFRARKSAWDAYNDKLNGMKSVERISDRTFWVDDLDAFLIELDDPFFRANFIQLNLYANSDFLKDRGVDHGAIVQYQKNKSKLREIRFRPSEKLYKETIKKMKNIVKAVDENKPELAPQEYEPGSYRSRYCDFCKVKTPGSCAMANVGKPAKVKK